MLPVQQAGLPFQYKKNIFSGLGIAIIKMRWLCFILIIVDLYVEQMNWWNDPVE